MDFLVYTLLGSTLYFGIILFLLLLAFIFAEAEENGFYAFLSFGVFAFLMHRFGDPSVFDLFTLRNITIYLLIGFVYGLIRSAHLGRTAAIDFKNKEILDQLKREEFRESSWLKIKNKLKGNFLRWWTLWFISGPIWMTSKFFSLMWDQLKEIPISIAKYFFDLQTKK